jgi:hypothetical protein
MRLGVRVNTIQQQEIQKVLWAGKSSSHSRNPASVSPVSRAVQVPIFCLPEAAQPGGGHQGNSEHCFNQALLIQKWTRWVRSVDLTLFPSLNVRHCLMHVKVGQWQETPCNTEHKNWRLLWYPRTPTYSGRDESRECCAQNIQSMGTSPCPVISCGEEVWGISKQCSVFTLKW